MHLPSTLISCAAVFAAFSTALPVGSRNSTSNATQTLGPAEPALNTTATNGTTSMVSATLLAEEIANNITGGKLTLDLVNNIKSDNVQAIVSGRDEQGKMILLDQDMKFYYPDVQGGADGDKTPLPDTVKHKLGPKDSTTTLTIPDYIYSARIYFSDGDLQMFIVKTPGGQGLAEPSPFNPDDPNKNLNWAFAELTNAKTWGLYANLSFVDFVGMALGLKLRRSGNDTTEVKGVPTGGKYKICNDLKDQAKKDGQPWDQLCINDDEGRLMRVLSPAGFVSMNKTAFSDYWYPYTNETKALYTKEPLTINTQAAAGMVKCTWQDSGELSCDGDNRPYAPPTAEDIFGCNTGPFAIQTDDNEIHKAVVPRLCAAYNRGTFTVNGGNVQPSVKPDEYYKTETLNWYSAVTHKNSLDHRGYAFSYDDVSPDVESDVAGIVTGNNPEVLTIFVGGHNSLASALLQEAQY